MLAVMYLGEFCKHTPHTHLHLAKPHGCWAEVSGVYMLTPNFNPTSTLEVHPKSWTQRKEKCHLDQRGEISATSGVQVGYKLGFRWGVFLSGCHMNTGLMGVRVGCLAK